MSINIKSNFGPTTKSLSDQGSFRNAMYHQSKENKMENKNTELATLGGGCFWCLEAVYEQVKGVDKVVSGYSGGSLENPTYEQVCSETTGHAEVVQVTFNTEIISYDKILRIFFAIHDPTTLNRQGYDIGSSYRSVIFHHSKEQKNTSEAIMKELGKGGLWDNPIVTEIKPLDVFYVAEGYHQNYYQNNKYQPYCCLLYTSPSPRD